MPVIARTKSDGWPFISFRKNGSFFRKKSSLEDCLGVTVLIFYLAKTMSRRIGTLFGYEPDFL